MRLKKGFTLAEILIVLMVIGVVATLTIPSLINAAGDAQMKTAYKKAYNTMVNLAAMEKINGNLPGASTDSQAQAFFQAMQRNLSVKEYAASSAAPEGTLLASSEYKTGVVFTSTADNPDAQDVVTTNWGTVSTTTGSPWLITEDNIAYQMFLGTDCTTRADINAAKTTANAAKASCVIFLVDVNGLSKTPNMVETQSGPNEVAQTSNMEKLRGDRYYIFIGSDGAATGSKATMIPSRIVSDAK